MRPFLRAVTGQCHRLRDRTRCRPIAVETSSAIIWYSNIHYGTICEGRPINKGARYALMRLAAAPTVLVEACSKVFSSFKSPGRTLVFKGCRIVQSVSISALSMQARDYSAHNIRCSRYHRTSPTHGTATHGVSSLLPMLTPRSDSIGRRHSLRAPGIGKTMLSVPMILFALRRKDGIPLHPH